MADDEITQDFGRPFWSGTVSFGLVNVPVGMFPANRSISASLRMVTVGGTPLKRHYYDQKGKQLAYDEIERGYEYEKGKFVVLDDDELERLAPDKTGNIDLRAFVKRAEIDPMYFERAYFLVPSGNNNKAYRLLAQVMEETELAGVATFVMRAKEYIAAIVAENGILQAETLRFADELRTPKMVGLPKPGRVAAREVAKFSKAIARLSKSSFDEDELENRAVVKLFDIIEKKAEKEQDVFELPKGAEEEEAPADTLDLMAAIEASLKKGKRKSA